MATKKRKILVIDDDPDYIFLAEEFLMLKYDMYGAIGGKEGIEKAFLIVPDLIILDIMMPDIDGFDVCRKLKGCDNEAIADIPIVMVTAKDDIESVIKGYSLGAIDYLSKPYDYPVILAKINLYMRMKTQKETIVEHADLAKRTTSILAHEFTNLLTQIMGWAAVIEEESKQTNISAKYLVAAAADLQRITVNILSLSLSTSPKLERFDFGQTLLDVLGDMPSHNFKVNFSHDYPSFFSSEGLVKIILRNLIHNAIIYGHNVNQEEKQTKKNRYWKEGEIEVGWHIEANYYVFWVKDEGEGISPDKLNSLFVDGQRLDNQIPGHGIGLYLVRSIARKLNGDAWVESSGKVGEGASFFFSLPIIHEG